jgi:hypothetical protein
MPQEYIIINYEIRVALHANKLCNINQKFVPNLKATYLCI